MRFASLQGGGTSDYAAAGKAAGDSAAKTFAIQRKSGPDYGKLSQVAMKTNSEEKIAAIKASAKVTKAGMDAYSDVTKTGHAVEVFNTKEDIKAKQRKAGGLAAIGKMAGVGFLAATDNTKGRERPTADLKGLYDKNRAARADIKTRQDQEVSDYGEFKETPFTPTPAGKDTGGGSVSSKTTSSPSTLSTSSGGSLSGNQKTVADAIAKYESGGWGYEAFNQGGAAGGTKVLGKSGSHKDTFGRSLTDMTLGEIYHKQNTKQRGLSMAEHINTGGLHAVGRYQFIGPTLQAEAKRMGLSPDTKFTPEVQDNIFLNHIKRVGDISPWVGPTNNYNASQKQDFRNMIAGF